MNNTFSLTRFIRYFKKHTVENGKTYLLSTAVLIGILILSLFFVVAMGNGHLTLDWQMTVLMCCALLGGSIFTSLTFADVGDKKKAIPMLTLPVSHLEKYLVSWIYTYIIFLIICIGGFYLVDIVAVSFSVASPYSGTQQKLLDLTSKETPGILLFTIFTLFHALAFWGAIYFDKLHFVKTAFVFFIALLGFNLLSKAIISAITDGNVGSTVFFQGSDIIVNGQRHFISPPDAVNQLGIIIFIAIVLLLWASAFFRLKEKQV
jgi:hypothetical protein